MKGVFFPERGRVEVRELPEPELLAPTDVLVRVTATTVCGSDLHIVAGHLGPEVGFPIGHEWVGVITAAGHAVSRFSVGDRVTGPAAPWCGSCDACRRGQRQRCLRGGVLGSGETQGGLGGAQSAALRVPWADQDLTLVPDGVTDAAALTVGDVLSTGWTGVRMARPGAGDSVLVAGCGPVGLSAVHTARRLTGAQRVIAVDTVELRLSLARRLGADVALRADGDVVGAVLELTGGRGADAVVDAAGVQATLDLAAGAVAVGGRIAMLGIPAAPLAVDFVSLLLRNVTLWTGLGDLGQMDRLMGLVADGVLDPTPMFTGECALEEVPELYGRMAAGDAETVKVLVRT